MSRVPIVYVVTNNGRPVSAFETKEDADKYVEMNSKRDVPNRVLWVTGVPVNMAKSSTNLHEVDGRK